MTLEQFKELSLNDQLRPPWLPRDAYASWERYPFRTTITADAAEKPKFTVNPSVKRAALRCLAAVGLAPFRIHHRGLTPHTDHATPVSPGLSLYDWYRHGMRCPECDHRVDGEGDTIDLGHCDECVGYSSDAPCQTCGFLSCDQSC